MITLTSLVLIHIFLINIVVWLSDTSFNFVVSFKFIEFLIGLDTDRQLINIADDFIKEVKEVLNKTRQASQSNISERLWITSTYCVVIIFINLFFFMLLHSFVYWIFFSVEPKTSAMTRVSSEEILKCAVLKCKVTQDRLFTFFCSNIPFSKVSDKWVRILEVKMLFLDNFRL